MSSKEIARPRKIIFRSLLIVSLPIVFLGLIDPLEGGIALLISLITLGAAFAMAGSWPSKSLWIPFVLSVVVGVITILVAIFGMDRANNQPQMLPLIALLWIYRALVVVTLIGLVREIILAFRGEKPSDSTSKPQGNN